MSDKKLTMFQPQEDTDKKDLKDEGKYPSYYNRDTKEVVQPGAEKEKRTTKKRRFYMTPKKVVLIVLAVMFLSSAVSCIDATIRDNAASAPTAQEVVIDEVPASDESTSDAYTYTQDDAGASGSTESTQGGKQVRSINDL